MTMGTGFGILVEEMVTVELEGDRTFVPEHSVQTHQPKSCISCPSMLIMHLNQGLTHARRRDQTPGIVGCNFLSVVEYP